MRLANPALGSRSPQAKPRNPDTVCEVRIRFDDDTAEEIRRFAAARGIPFTPAVRLLVEWGLEVTISGE